MSHKHFFSDTAGLVVNALESLTARNPSLCLNKETRVVYSKTHPPSRVALISGGGAGHEPAWAGFVGDGMLAAAVSGDIFASPSTKQIMSAIRDVPSHAGVILCITNYTGDKLHFGLAREKGIALGHKVEVVSMSEDASLPLEQVGLVGRRGLAGNIIVLKLLGAASAFSWSFERCLKLGNLGNSQLVTIGTSLDHCHVPGRGQHQGVPENACVLGMGIHNEPGLRTVSPIPDVEDLLKEMFLYLLDSRDKDRAFVEFGAGDEVVMLVNNFGGLSTLELEGLTCSALKLLESDWNIKPRRIYAGIFETSLNGPGFSITLGNLSGISRAMDISVEDVTKLLDEPTSAAAWPKNAYFTTDESTESAALRAEAREKERTSATQGSGFIAPISIISSTRKACQAAIAAEPEITRFDMEMGDGDCGEAVVGICKSILSRLDAISTGETPLDSLLHGICESIEEVGGSLGAILSILLTAFSNNVRMAESGSAVDLKFIASCLKSALGTLMGYTSARVGDRTVMDALIPFCGRLEDSLDLQLAVDAAGKGAQETAGMKAKFGRATYVGDSVSGKDVPPDPGAHAAAVFLRGFGDGLQA